MTIYDVGRVCIKKSGRETGRRCVVVDIVDKNFVVVTGPRSLTGVKRRRVNVDHLEPTNLKIDIQSGAEDEAVQKAMADAGLVEAPPVVAEERPKIAPKKPTAAKKTKKPAPEKRRPAARRKKETTGEKSGGTEDAPQAPGGE